MKIILFGLLLFIACKKEERCETWKFYDECVPKNSSTFCTNGPTPNFKTAQFCGDGLSGVSPGSTKVVREDANAKTVRHFVSKQ